MGLHDLQGLQLSRDIFLGNIMLNLAHSSPEDPKAQHRLAVAKESAQIDTVRYTMPGVLHGMTVRVPYIPGTIGP